MVDYDIYRRLHPKKAIFSDRTDDLGTEAMNKTEPPDDDFLAMMPPEIHAYDFSTKAWSANFPMIMIVWRLSLT
jgi:hypothetical protein